MLKSEKEETEDAPARRPTSSGMGVGKFKSPNCWGVKDKKGEWIATCRSKAIIMEIWNKDPEAYELYNGMDPFDVLIKPEWEINPPATFVERKKK